MSASLGLYRLQQVDRQLDRAQSRLDVIRKTLENDAELQAALAQMENAQSHHHRSMHDLKESELGVDSQKIKIEQNEASLYSGNVKNPKELQDLQKDILSLRKHLGTLEERQLEAMLQAESAETQMQSAKSTLESVQSRLGSEHKKLIEERDAHIKQLENQIEERVAALAPFSSEMLHTYEDLRRQKRGVAVTTIEDGACSACGTSLNAAMQQSARSQKQLAYCPSCGRILFAN